MGNSSGKTGKDPATGTGSNTPKGPLTYNPSAVALENHYVSVWSGGLTELESIVTSLGNVRGTQSIFSFIVYLQAVPTSADLVKIRDWCASQKTVLYELPGANTVFVISPAVKDISENTIRFLLRSPTTADENMEHVFYFSGSNTITGDETMQLSAPRLLAAIIHLDTGTILFTQPSPDIKPIPNFQMFTNFPAFKAVSLYPFSVFDSAKNVSVDYDYCMAYRLNPGDISGFVKLTNSAKKALNSTGTSAIVSVASWPNKNLEEYAYAYMKYTCDYMSLKFNKYTYGNMIYVYNDMGYTNNTVSVPGMSIKLLKNSDTAAADDYISFHTTTGTLSSKSLVKGIVSSGVLYIVSLSQASGNTVYVWNGKNGMSFDSIKAGGELTLSYTEVTDKIKALKFVSALPPTYKTALLFKNWTTLFTPSDVSQLLGTLKNYNQYESAGDGVVSGGFVHKELISAAKENDNYVGTTSGGVLVRLTTPKEYTESDVAVMQNGKFDNYCSSNRITYYSNELCFKNTKESTNCTIAINSLELDASREDLDTGGRVVFVLCRKATMADVIDAFDYIKHFAEYTFVFLFTANRANDTTDFHITPLTRVILDLKCKVFKYTFTKSAYQMYEYVLLKPNIDDMETTLTQDAESTGLVLSVANRTLFAISKEKNLIDRDSGKINSKINTALAPVIALIDPDYVKSTDDFTLPENVKSTGIEYIYQVFNEHLTLEDNTQQGNRVLDRRRSNLFSISLDSVDVNLNGRIFEYLKRKNNGIVFNYIRKCTSIAFQKLIMTLDELLQNFKRFEFAIVILFEVEESKIEIPNLDKNSLFSISTFVPSDDPSVTFVTILGKNITATYTTTGLEIRSKVGDERVTIVPQVKSLTADEVNTTVFMERRPKTRTETVSVPISYKYTLIEEPLFKGFQSNVVLIERDYKLTYTTLLEPYNLYKGHPVYYNTMNFDSLYTFIMHLKHQLEADPEYEFTCIIKLVPKRISSEIEDGMSSIVYLLNTDTWGIPDKCSVYKFPTFANICVFTTEMSSQAFSDGFELTSLDRRFSFIELPQEENDNTNTLPVLSTEAYTKYEQKKIELSFTNLRLSRDTPVYIDQFPVNNVEWYTITRQYSEPTAPKIPEEIKYYLNSINLLPRPKVQPFPPHYSGMRTGWLPRLFIFWASESLNINILVKHFHDHAEENKMTNYLIGPLKEGQFNIPKFESSSQDYPPRMYVELMDSKNNYSVLAIQGGLCPQKTIELDTDDNNTVLCMPVFYIKCAEIYNTNLPKSVDRGYIVNISSVLGCTNPNQPGSCINNNQKIYSALKGPGYGYGYTELPLTPIKEYSDYPHIQLFTKTKRYDYLTTLNPLFDFMDSPKVSSSAVHLPFIFAWPHQTIEPPVEVVVRNRPDLAKNFVIVASNVKPIYINTNLGSDYRVTVFELQSSACKYGIIAHSPNDQVKNDIRSTTNFILYNGKPVVCLADIAYSEDYDGIKVPKYQLKNSSMSDTRWSLQTVNVGKIACRLYRPI